MKIGLFAALAMIAASSLCVLPSASAQHVRDPAGFEVTDGVQPGALEAPALSSAQLEERAALTRLASLAMPTDGRVSLTPLVEGAIGLLSLVVTVVTGFVGAALNKRFNRQADAQRAQMINDWTRRAVEAAANYVKGAALGPDGRPAEVSFPVANEWVERALEQCIALFGGVLPSIGGEDAQRRRIWSMMRLPPNEAVTHRAPVDLRSQPTTTAPTAAPVP